MELSWDDVAWARIERSGLVEPFETAVEVARVLIGVQSQFVPPAGLAIRNRLATDFASGDLDDLLHDRRELLRLWGQRNTLHIYDAADWGTVVSASRAIPMYRERLTELLGREEAELEAAVGRVAEILRRVDRASRADFVAADPSLEPWFEYGNALVMDLVRRGVACHGALVGGKSYFAHREVWLPEMRWDPPSTEDAGVELARRYFETYGPATVRDFAFWLGGTMRELKGWVEALGGELIEVSVEGVRMLDSVGRSESRRLVGETPPRAEWPLHLLHRFDPLVLAHKDKRWIVDDEHYKAVWRKAGYVEAVILKHGRIVGTWGYKKKARGIRIRIAPFNKLLKKDVVIVEREAESAAAYFESPLVAVEIQ